jgi:hypothetical protein
VRADYPHTAWPLGVPQTRWEEMLSTKRESLRWCRPRHSVLPFTGSGVVRVGHGAWQKRSISFPSTHASADEPGASRPASRMGST